MNAHSPVRPHTVLVLRKSSSTLTVKEIEPRKVPCPASPPSEPSSSPPPSTAATTTTSPAVVQSSEPLPKRVKREPNMETPSSRLRRTCIQTALKSVVKPAKLGACEPPPVQLQTLDCVEWYRYQTTSGSHHKYDLPMCLDCFCLVRKAVAVIPRHKDGDTSCRFRDIFIRRLVVDQHVHHRKLDVHSMVLESEKKEMAIYKPDQFIQPDAASELSQQARLYVLRHAFRTLESVVQHESQAVGSCSAAASPTVQVDLPLKSPVDGIRESCDVCQTSIFDLHWLCQFCAFAVCVDCYVDRQQNGVSSKWELQALDPLSKDNLAAVPRDGLNWMPCCSNPARSFPPTGSETAFRGMTCQQWPHDLTPVRMIPLSIMTNLLTEARDILADHPLITSNIKREHDPPASGGSAISLCGGGLLWLPKCPRKDSHADLAVFRNHWKSNLPVLVSRITSRLKQPELWLPETFGQQFGPKNVTLVDCSTPTQEVYKKKRHRDFWDGFDNFDARFRKEDGSMALWKIKDWPTRGSFADILPDHFTDLMQALPINSYTNHRGDFNLAKYLPSWCNPPDLGPKMYAAYGSSTHPHFATTNLHVDISDAVNVIVHVGLPEGRGAQEEMQSAMAALAKLDLDQDVLDRLTLGEVPGAVWQIYHPDDALRVRDFIRKIRRERGMESDDDPIHCQMEYLDLAMRERLSHEHDIRGMDIVQFEGDGIFIPASAPHQVWNLHSCIKVAEDFVTPENVPECVLLTKDFRNLPNEFSNKADKLQIKNILFHTVKTMVASFRETAAPVADLF